MIEREGSKRTGERKRGSIVPGNEEMIGGEQYSILLSLTGRAL